MRLPVTGMREPDLGRVERLAREGRGARAPSRPARPVDAVADDRMTRAPPGGRAAGACDPSRASSRSERRVGAAARRPPARDRGARARDRARSCACARAGGGRSAGRSMPSPRSGGRARRRGSASRSALAELPAERLERGARPRDQQHAGGVAVEAMDDPWSSRGPTPGARRAGARARARRVPRRAPGAGWTTMPGGLSIASTSRVLVEDAERHRLRLDVERLGRGERRPRRARPPRRRWDAFRGDPSTAHVRRVDQLLRVRASPDPRHRREDAIEPRSRGRRRHEEREPARRPSSMRPVPAHGQRARARATSAAIAARSASGPLNETSPRSRSTSSTTSQCP